MLLLNRKMGPTKGRRIRKIEVLTVTPTECELGDTTADRQSRREEREQRERGRRQRNNRGRRGRERKPGWRKPHTQEGVVEKCPRTSRSGTEMNRDGGGEADTSQLHSRYKKGHMTNIYLTDSDEEAIVDFVKDYEEI